MVCKTKIHLQHSYRRNTAPYATADHNTSDHEPKEVSPDTWTLKLQNLMPWQPASLPDQKSRFQHLLSESWTHHLHHHLESTLSLLFTTLMPSNTTIYFNTYTIPAIFKTAHTLIRLIKVITEMIQVKLKILYIRYIIFKRSEQ